MNLRQKAKKYKMLAELNKIKAEAYDRMMLSEAFKQLSERKSGTIETIKVVRLWNDRIPDIFVRKEISAEFVKSCLENGLIYFKVDGNYDERTMCRKVTGIMKVCKDWWEEKK